MKSRVKEHVAEEIQKTVDEALDGLADRSLVEGFGVLCADRIYAFLGVAAVQVLSGQEERMAALAAAEVKKTPDEADLIEASLAGYQVGYRSALIHVGILREEPDVDSAPNDEDGEHAGG